MKVTVLLLLAVITYINAVKWHQLHTYNFEDFVSEFKPQYKDDNERAWRKQIFDENLRAIRQHNADSTKTWKKGVNMFTDRTHEELKSLRGLTSVPIHKQTQESIDIDVSFLAGANVDWRTSGIITSVKDQGQCGSCWSFATAETLESYWALETKQLVDLSEQQVLDCTPNPDHCGGTGGCGGGTVELGYTNIMKLGGLATEWTYPYQSYFGHNFQCRFSSNTPPFAKISGYKNLPSNQYAPLALHIATVGPLAISVDASAWSSYETGVFDGCNQTNPDLDHAVQLVGLGTDPEYGDYWLVRNSWSPAWGEEGYIRLRRTSSEQERCGIDLNPGDGDGCDGGPSQIKVCGTCGILYDAVYPVVSK